MDVFDVVFRLSRFWLSSMPNIRCHFTVLLCVLLLPVHHGGLWYLLWGTKILVSADILCRPWVTCLSWVILTDPPSPWALSTKPHGPEYPISLLIGLWCPDHQLMISTITVCCSLAPGGQIDLGISPTPHCNLVGSVSGKRSIMNNTDCHIFTWNSCC